MTVKKQGGFSVTELLLILLGVGIIAGTGWYVWHSTNSAKDLYSKTSSLALPKAGPIKSFDDCKKAAGSKIQETYPEVCVTKDGKRFVNANSSTNEVGGAKNKTYINGYLHIKEWGVKIPVTQNVHPNYRIFQVNNVKNVGASFHSKELETLSGNPDCTSNSVNVFRGLANDQYIYGETGQSSGMFKEMYNKWTDSGYAYFIKSLKIGDYYYLRQGFGDATCLKTNSDTVKESGAINSLRLVVESMTTE